jgi:2-polyprenyl-3-methyl-5-hydroxy-6-metoxy-1,4-benzoquinol methylase
MAVEDSVKWDEIYLKRALEVYPPPEALLVAYAPQPEDIPRRVALDLAAGLCQNAIWLAEQGYLVNAMDISRVALERGRAEMAMRNLRNVNFILADLDAVELPEAVYDLVCCFHYLNRALFPQIQASVSPGGMVIYQTYNIRRLQTRPTTARENLLELRELPGFFPGWEVLHDDDVGELSRLVTRKPGAGQDRGGEDAFGGA